MSVADWINNASNQSYWRDPLMNEDGTIVEDKKALLPFIFGDEELIPKGSLIDGGAKEALIRFFCSLRYDFLHYTSVEFNTSNIATEELDQIKFNIVADPTATAGNEDNDLYQLDNLSSNLIEIDKKIINKLIYNIGENISSHFAFTYGQSQYGTGFYTLFDAMTYAYRQIYLQLLGWNFFDNNANTWLNNQFDNNNSHYDYNVKLLLQNLTDFNAFKKKCFLTNDNFLDFNWFKEMAYFNESINYINYSSFYNSTTGEVTGPFSSAPHGYGTHWNIDKLCSILQSDFLFRLVSRLKPIYRHIDIWSTDPFNYPYYGQLFYGTIGTTKITTSGKTYSATHCNIPSNENIINKNHRQFLLPGLYYNTITNDYSNQNFEFYVIIKNGQGKTASSLNSFYFCQKTIGFNSFDSSQTSVTLTAPSMRKSSIFGGTNNSSLTLNFTLTNFSNSNNPNNFPRITDIELQIKSLSSSGITPPSNCQFFILVKPWSFNIMWQRMKKTSTLDSAPKVSSNLWLQPSFFNTLYNYYANKNAWTSTSELTTNL